MRRILIISFLVITATFISPKIIPAATFSPPILPGENQQIYIVGSTVNIKGITDQTNKLIINKRELSVEKDGSFSEEIIIPLGSTEIEVSVIDKQGNVKSYKKKIEAQDKYFFLVAIADGTVNFTKADKGRDIERDNIKFDKGTRGDGKISYYLAGKIQGKYLVKSSLDTDKSTQEKLFSNIDPQEYYPIYGDNSTVVYDVNSQGKFYLLVEWDKSGFTFGNYQTMFDETELSKYNRTLYGGKFHLETPQRTSYGEPKGKLTGFYAEANQYAGHSEFLATGGSLYYLRHRNISEGSEKISIDIRDKNTGMTIYSLPQKENVDYEIKYDEGRIFFKKAVLSIASSDTIISNSILEGNPVYIVVNYEYKSQEAFPIHNEDLDRNTGGVRASRTIGDHVRVGVTYLKEQKDNKDLRIYGQDATIKIGNFTQVDAELAQSNADSVPLYMSYNGGLDFTKISQGNSTRDDARRFSLKSSLGEYFGLGKDFLDFDAYYQKIGRNFCSADTLFQAGTRKYGAELSHKITDNDSLRLLVQREELEDDNVANEVAGGQLSGETTSIYGGQWVHTVDKLTFTQEYQERHINAPSTLYDDTTTYHTFAERVDYKVNKDTSLFLGQQITLSGQAHNQTQLGIATKLDKTQVQAQTAFGNAGHSVLLGLTEQKDETTQTYMNYSITNSKISGKSSSTAVGANTKITKDATLKTERQFVTSDQRGVFASQLMGVDYQATPRLNFGMTYQKMEEQLDSTLISSVPRNSTSFTAAYIRPEGLKTNIKFEFREDTDNTDQFLTENSAELKLTQDIFLFGEYQYSVTNKPDSDAYARIDVKHIGLAFRPVAYDWFNWLFKYIRLSDERPEGLDNADVGFIKVDSIADIYATEFALDLPLNFQLVEKVAYKNEHTLSYDYLGFVKTPEERQDLLYINRINYHLNKKWDVAGEYRLLRQKGTDINTIERGYLFEANREVVQNIYMGAGYNSTSFTDDLGVKSRKSGRGFFFRVQGRY